MRSLPEFASGVSDPASIGWSDPFVLVDVDVDVDVSR